ncbi:MAG: curli assembly protein CsgF [Mucilaginibacter sp.]
MRILWIYFGLLTLFSAPTTATELVHHFVNPNFGGNPLNGPMLLNEANAQNQFKDQGVARAPVPQQTAIERFKSSLQSAILGQVSRTAAQNLFDNNGNIKLGSVLNFDPNGDGSSTFSVQVSSAPVNGNITLNISDGISNTVLTVPYIAPTTQ